MLRATPRIRDIQLPPYDPLNIRAAELRSAGHDVISLGQAIPFYPPPAAVVAAARAALETPAVHGYTTDPGRPALRALVADRLRRSFDVDADAQNVIITAGANHAFMLAAMTVIDPDDEVVLPAPYFTNHEMAIRARGATPVEAPVADRRT